MIRTESGTTRHGSNGEETGGSFRVGGAWIQPDLNRIRAAEGETIQVEPRVMNLLVHLARNAGRVVSREELMGAVWGETVVGEKALTRAVWSLRQMLGDDPKSPTIIETIRKGGYRLIAPVEWVDDQEGGAGSAGRTVWKRRALPAIAGIIAAAALLGWLFGGRDGERAVPPLPKTVPFTSYLGKEYTPGFSPDGTRVVFAWDGPDESDFDIYVKQKDTETPLRLTADTANDNLPVWSADGRTVYFVRHDADVFSICSVPAIGGEIRTLYATARGIWNLAASPAGGNLVFSEECSTGTAFRAALFSVETLAKQWLTDPPPTSRGDFYASFSPDGRTVAFSRADPIGFHRIHTVEVEGGEASPVGAARRHVQGLAWLDDGELIVSSLHQGRYALWRLSLKDGAWTGIPTQAGSIWFPAVSPDRTSLIYESARYDLSIYEIDLSAPEPRVSGEPLIGSTRWEDEPRFSPDGSRIAFVSDRTGFPELWACRADGTVPVQLTQLRSEALLSPCWSPEGERVAFFVSSGEGTGAVCAVDVNGGVPRTLLQGETVFLPSSWSADGRFLYLDSDRDGAWRVWKLAIGEEEPCLAIPGEVSRARESADGGFVYYGRVREPGLWRMPVVGGAEEVVLSAADVGAGLWGNWDLVGDRVFFCGDNGIGVYDPAAGVSHFLAEASGIVQSSLTVSPDGKRVLFAGYRGLEVDLVLMRDFR
ncbi:MAG: PD40 domain-containing protein [Candidatus Eisenbacteria bacterium]|nr:PD40 domain-containing protein [Candidatus Eisenbacteria bacterium]